MSPSLKAGKMPSLNFKTLSFSKEEDGIKVTLLKLFTAKIPLEELESLGKYKIDYKIRNAHALEFKDEKAKTRFLFLLSKYFQNLRNKINGNPAVYIHRNSGIPLIGNVAFGIVYRNSSVIEIKPVTSCNLNCIYCSISEGLESRKTDFVVEKDYLVEELKKLVEFIDEPVEVHIGVQGEPLLYADIEELISDLQKMEKVQTISIDTNGTLLNKKMIDRLAKNSKLQVNFSLDAIDEEKARKLAGTKTYNVGYIKEMISYAAKKLNKVIVAPVLVQGYNEDEMEKIILFIKSIKGTKKSIKEKTRKQPVLGIQNFLSYKTGKHPAKELPWEKFYQILDKLEQKHQIKLKFKKEDFNIRKTKDLPKPFKENDVIAAVLKCPDRFPNTSIAAARNRNISAINCPFRAEKHVKIKILRDKHNIFVGKSV